MNYYELKKSILYIWPDCLCCGKKQSYGWWGNIRTIYKLVKLINRGFDLEELKQHLKREQLRKGPRI